MIKDVIITEGKYGICPLAMFQAASRGHSRLDCVGAGCAWWMGDSDCCVIWFMASELSDIGNSLSEIAKDNELNKDTY